MRAFLHRPQSVFARRALFQVHLWIGVLAGLYVFVVCITGAALVFRIDMQRALNPDLFTPGAGPATDPATVLERVRDAFPAWRVSGIDAPTTARPTYLAYVARGDRFLTLLVDPATARVLGELPERSLVRTLQDLHFDLLAGRTGRLVNGVGALLLLGLCATGLVIWWPGLANWRRGLTVDVGRNWKRVIWDLHSVTGICGVIFIAMWAATGAYFAFPSQFRAAVNSLSTLTVATTPVVAARPPGTGSAAPSWRELIDRARRQVPDQFVARVVPPYDERSTFLVMFSPVTPYPAGSAALTSVYLNPYTGDVIANAPPVRRTIGDAVMAWVAPLHVGNFAGNGVKTVWFVFGLAPPVLFATGFLMWWTRVVRSRWLKLRRHDATDSSLTDTAAG